VKQPSSEQFLKACGVREPPQLEVECGDSRETIRPALSLPFALVGRDEHADVPLDDAQVSLRHTYLQVVAGRLWWMDLDSRTGTHGRQGRQAAGPLDSGQCLRIGPFRIHLRGAHPPNDSRPSPANPLSSGSYASLALPRVRLDFLEGTAKPSLWTVDRALTLVGRASHCKVRLHSPLISRTHCALLHTADGLWVIDLRGREGIHVNGTAVRWALLEDSDELRIGQFRIRVDDPGAPTRETSSALPSETTAIVPSRTFAETLLSTTVPFAPMSSSFLSAGGAANESLLLPLVAQFSQMQQQMFDQFQQALTTMVHMFSGLHHNQMQLIRQEMNHLHELTRELQGLQTELARQTPAPSREVAPSPRRIAQPVPSAPAEPRPSGSETTPSTPSASPARSDADAHAWLTQRLVALQQERQSRWQKIVNVLTGKRTEEGVP
jgi:pSer/pThr/pTyr-binding forkhead associated (FHA) protein